MEQASRLQWSIYNLFMKKGAATDRKDAIAPATDPPDVVPVPPILPVHPELRQAVLEAIAGAGESPCDTVRIDKPQVKAGRGRRARRRV